MLKQIIRLKIQDLKFKKYVSLRGVENDEAISIKRLPHSLSFVRNDNKLFNAIQKSKGISIIAELKFASPNEGNIASPRELIKRARAYEKAGVDAISIITEKHFFKGDASFVKKVKKEVKLPILQKDFVIDVSQIMHARVIGSDGLLLIARIVTAKKLQEFVDLCLKLKIEPVVEIGSKEDLQKAKETNTRIIAVNARDLDTFKVDVNMACLLMKKIPVKFTRIGFSGIVSKKEAVLYKKAGAKAILIGTAFMRKIPTKKEIMIFTKPTGSQLLVANC